MKLDYKLFYRLTLALGVLTPLSFILRIYTYWKELDVTSGFFSGKSAGCFVFNVIAFAVFFLCLLLTYRKKGVSIGSAAVSAPVKTDPEDDSLVVQDGDLDDEVEEEFPQYFLHGFAKRCSVWQGTFSAFAAFLLAFGFISHGISFLLDKESLSDPYVTVYLALSLISGAFYLFYAFRNSAERSRFLAVLSLAPAFWCTLRMIIEYRDLTRFLNKGLYVGQFLFVIAALVFFLYQAQILLGEEVLARPNAYVFSGAAVAFLGLTARLPQLFAMMGNRVQFDLFASTSLLADLAITLFVISKLLATTKRP